MFIGMKMTPLLKGFNKYFFKLYMDFKNFHFRKFLYLYISFLIIWWISCIFISSINFYIIYLLVYLIIGALVKTIFKATSPFYLEIFLLVAINVIARGRYEFIGKCKIQTILSPSIRH